MPAERRGSFDDLPLSERARDVVHALGWTAPTPIQTGVIPQLVHHRDVIGRAETGSGKTAAFGLALVDAIEAPGIQALVLAPTRELAQQVASDLNILAATAPFRAIAIHGGVPIEPQVPALGDDSITCIVATTGRLLDLCRERPHILAGITHVIIDEADRMLDLGFLPEVERVLKLIPSTHQTALFSATLPKKIADLAHQYMAHPRVIEVGDHTPDTATHYRVDIHSAHKFVALIALLEKENPTSALVFARTRQGARTLAQQLKAAEVRAEAFHGDLDQHSREDVVAALKSGRVRIVVATDVAARGLHVPGLTHVINYDAPEDAEAYVHRAGRTARSGKSGRVFTLVTENDVDHVAKAEQGAHARFQSYVLPGTPAMPEGATLTRDEPLTTAPPGRSVGGGYAKGAKKKKEGSPPKSPGWTPKTKAKDRSKSRKRPEFDLPPSRRGGE